MPPPGGPPQPGWGQHQPQPGWGQQQPQQPGGSNNTGLLVGLAAVAILVVGGVIFLVTGDDDSSGGGSGAGGGSPEAVVESFADALLNGDCDTAVPMATDHWWEPESGQSNLDACEDQVRHLPGGISLKGTELQSESDSEAIVSVTFEFAGETEPERWFLVKEADAWLIDDYDVG